MITDFYNSLRMMPLPKYLALALLLVLVASCAHRSPRNDGHVFQVESEGLKIDRIYRSMEGPTGHKRFKLVEDQTAELIWLRGIRAEIVDLAADVPVSPEYMCHANLDITDTNQYQEDFKYDFGVSPRIATLSQGQLAFQLPDGFGVPILSTNEIGFSSQVLNLNDNDKNITVKQRIEIDYVRDRDVDRPMIPLFGKSVYAMAAVDGQPGFYGMRDFSKEKHGPGCLIGNSASTVNEVGENVFTDQFGRRYTGHWVVPPGRQVNRSLVTHLLQLPFDTTVHYVVVHLHPFAESLELRDLTTGETLFKSIAVNRKRGVGLVDVEPYSSRTGFPLYTNHDYEVISIYNNTTTENQDAMAVMYMFLANKKFRKPGFKG